MMGTTENRRIGWDDPSLVTYDDIHDVQNNDGGICRCDCAK